MTEDRIVLTATDLTREAIDLLEAAEGIVVRSVVPKVEQVRDNIAEATALITRDEIRLDADMLERAKKLKVIARVSPSLTNVDLEVATAKGILVMNTPGASAVAAGEHTFALMLALSRRLMTVHNSLREGYWLLERKRQVGTQLSGKTLGLIGLGRVGRVVTQRALAFGMNILAYDPYISEDNAPDRVQLVGLSELLSRSDFVSLHVPFTRETNHIINAQTIAQMKPGARLINTSVGSAIDEAAVIDAMKSGHLGGVALDVYNEEPPYNSPLIGMDGVVHTPHIGDNTVEATQDLSLSVVRQVLDALFDRDYRNVVNMPLLPGADYDQVRPYVHLAESIGRLHQALARVPVRRVAVEVVGEELDGLIKVMTVGILKGLLQPILGDAVSAVNAPVLATERGWQITQVKGVQKTDYSNAITCQVTLEDGETITITGTLLDRMKPYIVQINEYIMNFVPEGHMLMMGSYDKPGVIGRVGTLMAERGVNIASWHTGRAEKGGQTLTVLNLDEPLADAIFKDMEQLDFVRHLHRINL
ncbi:MAG: phosphoglycerate dehydrogenase [Anaerolineae bacterium]|nr:phosphoglycerate dehydrogenase [Anaerolineae bacterium]